MGGVKSGSSPRNISTGLGDRFGSCCVKTLLAASFSRKFNSTEMLSPHETFTKATLFSFLAPRCRCSRRFLKRDADFKPLLTHWVSSRIVLRTEAVHRMPVACSTGVKAGHGLTRVLSFGSPSGWRDQRTVHRTPRVHHIARRRGGGVAGRGTRTTTGKLPHIGVLVSRRLRTRSLMRSGAVCMLSAIRKAEHQGRVPLYRRRSHRAEEFAEERPARRQRHRRPLCHSDYSRPGSHPNNPDCHGAWRALAVGAIDSLARPGGNVTGLSMMDAEIGGKRVQLLRELIPNLSRIAVVTAPTTSPFGPPFVEDLRVAATSAGLGFEPILIGGPSEFRSAFAAMDKAGVQAAVIQMFFDPHRAILMTSRRISARYMSGSRDVTAAGGLVSMAANSPELHERAAFYDEKILKGAKPSRSTGNSPQNFRLRLT